MQHLIFQFSVLEDQNIKNIPGSSLVWVLLLNVIPHFSFYFLLSCRLSTVDSLKKKRF